MPNRKNYGILICVGEGYKILKHPIRGSVGTGRRARLRILWWLHRVGSSPIFRTKSSGWITWAFLLYRKDHVTLKYESYDSYRAKSPSGGSHCGGIFPISCGVCSDRCKNSRRIDQASIQMMSALLILEALRKMEKRLQWRKMIFQRCCRYHG